MSLPTSILIFLLFQPIVFVCVHVYVYQREKEREREEWEAEYVKAE